MDSAVIAVLVLTATLAFLSFRLKNVFCDVAAVVMTLALIFILLLTRAETSVLLLCVLAVTASAVAGRAVFGGGKDGK